MQSAATNIYQEIAERTGGNIYIGVVGPVRTGKSTFVKRVMETLVIPHIENVYQRERAKDELPQSGSGKTIMTSEPKFVPEDAVSVSLDDTAKLSVRMIDSVGYMIPGAMGAEEDGQPRMVTTPWFPDEIPMTQAAELGTRKIMEEHCSIGIIITTDGTVTDIPREDYIDAEKRAIADMKATGKPFLVLINTAQPEGREVQELRRQLEADYAVPCLSVNCLTLQEHEITDILGTILKEFPVTELRFYLPHWMNALPMTHPLKKELFAAIRQNSGRVNNIRCAESNMAELKNLKDIENARVSEIDSGSGIVNYEIRFPAAVFYGILSDESGFQIKDDADLMYLLRELSTVKRSYDKVAVALEQVKATGYGIVMPTPEEMHLEVPQIVRKGGNYGVKMKASAPSIHMLRADIETEISPIVGDEKQSEDLLQYLLQEYEGDTEKLWQSNIFGKSVYELVNEGLGTKLKRMPEEAQFKLQNTLSRIINEGSSGLLCIILS